MEKILNLMKVRPTFIPDYRLDSSASIIQKSIRETKCTFFKNLIIPKNDIIFI
jgi:hypothetical protein